MPEVEVSRCGGVEGALRRLKRLSENSRIMQDQREEYFVSPSEEKAAAKKAAGAKGGGKGSSQSQGTPVSQPGAGATPASGHSEGSRRTDEKSRTRSPINKKTAGG